MGKQRRKRTQYHFSSNKNSDENESFNKSSETSVSGFKINIPENIFKDVKIDLDRVNKNVDEDSRSVRSVKSISKSVKSFKRSLGDFHLKKNDKRSLRRKLFLKKIELSYVHLNENKQNKKRTSNLLSISEMDKILPNVDLVFHKPKPIKEKYSVLPNPPKLRGIFKAKDRKKSMTNNLAEFKKLIGDVSFKINPFESLTECIETKILNEEL